MNQSRLVQDRIRKIVAIAIVIFLLFGLRLIEIQAIRANGYVEKANVELGKTATLLAPRGTIYDINGVELARSITAINIAVDQTVVNDPVTAANIVAPILGMTPSQLLPDLTGERRYVLIAKDITPAKWSEVYEAIEKYNSILLKSKAGISKRIAGFVPERSYIRDYPSGLLTASLVGIINDQGAGASGIESSLNNLLAGTNGKYAYANGRGKIIPGSERVSVEAKAGTSIRLTIDRDIQWVAQNAINQAVSSARAQSGTVIVMDPKTGAILAQASAPTFDPNNSNSITLGKLRNPAVQDVYEPGSTGKVITVAAAMEEGLITPESVFTIPYKMKVADEYFHDHEKHPTQRLTTTGLLAVSSNTGSIQIGQKLGKDRLYEYLRKFGMGQSTNSKLPGESAGSLLQVKDWSGTSLPTFAFGQGYSLTAMQTTSVFATIANNGVRVSPSILAGVVDESGKYTQAKENASVRVLSEQTSQNMRAMMESVVSKNGTAPSAAIPGYRIAGKTGTANRYNTACGCYSGYTASFVGFAPADAPEFVVSVTIQDPQGMHWGGVLAGPVFKKVMSFVLQSKRVQPTKTDKTIFSLTEAALKSAVSTKAKSGA
ncbi:cell division protein FtsI (penicillin-binding protein 3) [Candidatus Nanopelagicus hibericus]|jgi:cell division protein FtsI (penicillin-binding protein 3)|uniref:Cell division protein FtsI (Penicillin-binding protein 3) n=1 Tax=Candidatus Nanopelagicus hibericus TaxID=1884915 RepID=A0A249K9G1_9ACTN|nr:penicillin-binding protein 2 [Candidatus Nanopelagicus hibericus]ASY13433.1 cell division protein FtsI (penicillin-binding protein 3) [Candidatus Nanopelagicus hibericus]